MKRQVAATLAVVAACLLLATPARAQNSQNSQSHAEDDNADSRESRRDSGSLAVGVGIADVNNVGETYFTAALRLRVGGHRDDRKDRDDNPDWRGRNPESSGMRGYFEPEIGYWKASGKNGNGSDLLLGVNLVGVVPLGSVDTYIGIGVGAHRLDAELLRDATTSDKATKVGVNAQFGLDIFLTRSLSLFGTGRFDLVQDARNNVQSKVYLGLRGRF